MDKQMSSADWSYLPQLFQHCLCAHFWLESDNSAYWLNCGNNARTRTFRHGQIIIFMSWTVLWRWMSAIFTLMCCEFVCSMVVARRSWRLQWQQYCVLEWPRCSSMSKKVLACHGVVLRLHAYHSHHARQPAHRHLQVELFAIEGLLSNIFLKYH